jgi:hypothetical protein
MSPDEERLLAWLKSHHVEHTLEPFEFPDSGRGLRSSVAIAQSHVMFSIPEHLLMTTRSAMRSDLGIHLRQVLGQLTSEAVMCLHLLHERSKGNASFGAPYIATLPKTYTTSYYMTEDDLKAIEPASRRGKIASLPEKVDVLYDRVVSLLPAPLLTFSRADFQWAHATLMTRGCFFAGDVMPVNDCYSLVPFGDFFNFTHDSSKCGFDSATQRYQFCAGRDYVAGEELFICYGPHDNFRLLCDYGFCLRTPCPNRYDCIEFPVSLPPDIDARVMRILRENGLLKNWYVTDEEPSFNLMTSLRLLVCGKAGRGNSLPPQMVKRILDGDALDSVDEDKVQAMLGRACANVLKARYSTSLAGDKALLAEFDAHGFPSLVRLFVLFMHISEKTVLAKYVSASTKLCSY